MAKSNTAYLSTIVNMQLKEAMTKYCQKKGLKINRFVEEALLEHLEDVADLATYEERRLESKISLDELLKSLK